MTQTPVAPPALTTQRASGCPFDPPPSKTALLESEPISRVSLWNGATAWLVTRHADQVTLLRDPRISADNRRPNYPSMSAASEATRDQIRAFINMDEPEHNAERRKFTGDFTIKRMRALTPRIEQIITDLLDAMEEAGPPTDLVTSFALPLPSLVICELLGVPYSDHAFFQRNSAVMVDTRSTSEAALAATKELGAYLGDLVESKVANPADDLLSRLATGYLKPGHSTKRQCANEALLLLVAGHETTANMIALGTCALLQNPAQLAAVRDSDPARVANAVEEMLRYLTITHMGRRRVATADIEVGGQLIKAGEALICSGDTANRDPEVFQDPYTLDIDRQARQHLAFGSGPHQCLGQNLARVELQLAYPALLRRFPGLRLDVPLEEIPFRTEMAVYGVHSLPVAW
ncbi:cytochrome P450 [Streptomyces tsukubensis]|uniref:Cytochrome n=1 Tax=Streptomyces tsukubensis TaxID=83656 RepID=A0A1V4ABX0_9ACTN|nr:cytochrome P450 [Streptomyces tsukubensis]OON80871.1 cytochrome [Streptomyces tsukubensis]QFR93488.1 cytochrome P450 [Streptomyces tsukubensis]